MELKHVATREGRLSTFLKGELGLSTGLMNKLKWNQRLYVNGIPRHADFPVSVGDEITALLTDRAMQVYAAKEAQYGDALMREVERVMLLRAVDSHWMDHIDNMDELRRGIHLRAIGQHDPVVVYRNEGFEMFEQMVAAIREDTARAVLTVQLRAQQEPERKQVAKETGTSADGTDKKQPVRKTAAQKVGRNDPCPCGSGKKYKQCCGR